MPDNQVSIKDLFATVRKDPALMITALVVFVGLLYYLYKKGSGAAGAPAASTAGSSTASTGYTPAMGTYTYVEDIHQGALPMPITAGPIPSPVQPLPMPTPGPIATVQRPLIPYRYFSGGKFPSVAGKPTVVVPVYSYQGVTYSVTAGAGGRVWGTPQNGGPSVLLYGAANAY